MQEPEPRRDADVLDAEVLAHRRPLARPVAIVVGAAALLCAAAFGRSLVGTPKATRVSAAGLVALPTLTATTASIAAGSATLAPPAPTGTLASAPEEPGTAPIASASATPSVSAEDTHKARELRNAAQRALEGGDAKGARALARSATVTDPTDAEAWLVLGGAELVAGDPVAAKAAFGRCARTAKHGHVGDCAALAR